MKVCRGWPSDPGSPGPARCSAPCEQRSPARRAYGRPCSPGRLGRPRAWCPCRTSRGLPDAPHHRPGVSDAARRERTLAVGITSTTSLSTSSVWGASCCLETPRHRRELQRSRREKALTSGRDRSRVHRIASSFTANSLYQRSKPSKSPSALWLETTGGDFPSAWFEELRKNWL